MNLMTWLIAFWAMFWLDVCWVLYLRAAHKNYPFFAAVWATALHVLGAVTILAYVHDKRYLTATIAGTFFGTFAVVAWLKRKDAKASRNSPDGVPAEER